MTTLPDPPEPFLRPHLAFWLWQRGITLADAGAVLGVGPEQVRRYCLPFGRSERVVPSKSTIALIVAWTRGAVVAGDFYPPHLSGDVDKLHLARAE